MESLGGISSILCAVITDWVWSKYRTLVCQISQATNEREHRWRAATGDVLEIHLEASKDCTQKRVEAV